MNNETKSPEMKEFVDGVSRELFGRSLSESKSEQICVVCGKPATAFKNERSQKEYNISGLCQSCQDEFFG